LPFDARYPLVLHLPFKSCGIEVAEVASPEGSPSLGARALSVALANAGFSVVRTHPRGPFVLDDLVAAWLSPQVAYLHAGGSKGRLAASLRTFGFTRLAGDWGEALQSEAIAALVARRVPWVNAASRWLGALPRASEASGEEDPLVVGATVASLGAMASRVLRTKAVAHPSSLDVAVREVVGFPLLRTSLCRYLTIAAARELLRAKGDIQSFVSLEDIAQLEDFIGHGREYYVGSRS
jgi:hypothetical protein